MRPHNNAGFSLVELMITLAVTGILLAVAVPAFQSNLDKRRLIGATEQLYADLQYARSEAIKRNATVFVSFTAGANWCYGIALAACNCGAVNGCQLDAGVNKMVLATDFRGVTLAQTFGASMNFEPRHGLVADNGSATFTSSTGAISVVVGNVGRVRICSASNNLAQYRQSSGSCP